MNTLRLAVASAILTLLCGAAPPPDVSTRPDVTPSSIDEAVEQHRAAVDVPGVAVAVTHGNAVLHAAGYGHSPDGTPITAHSTMATASLSKSFTALAVAQLVEGGRLGLDDPVQQHLPEFTMKDPRAPQITIRELLEQTSGLTDDTVGQFTRVQPGSLAASVADFRDRAVAHDPGSTWEYYNPNYQIAARVVEVASGQSFGSYLDDHVFAPLRMADSRAIATAAELPPSARGHVRLLGQPIALPEPPAFGNGSGGVLSSADDMASWLIMQSGLGISPDGSRLVTPTSIEAMRTPSPASRSYGLGWDVGTTPGGSRLVSHGGDLFTATAFQAVMPDAGYGVAVLTNTGMAQGDARDIAQRIIALIERSPAESAADPSFGIDAVIVGASAVLIGLATAGIRRSSMWAGRRGGWPSVTARTAPLLIPVALLPSMAPIVRFLYRGRDVSWLQTVYLYPSFTIGLALVAAVTTTLVIARVSSFSRR